MQLHNMSSVDHNVSSILHQMWSSTFIWLAVPLREWWLTRSSCVHDGERVDADSWGIEEGQSTEAIWNRIILQQDTEYWSTVTLNNEEAY